jgi:hypothetical protein
VRRLRELVALVRLAKPGGRTVSAFLEEHASELGDVLDVRDLLGSDLDDVELRARLAPRVEEALRTASSSRSLHRGREADRAAEVLGRTARWSEGRAVLDVELLLGHALGDPTSKALRFLGPSFDVVVPRDLLLRVRRDLPTFLDRTAWVEGDGLHFGWRGGRGHLRLRHQVLPRVKTTVVPVAPPVARMPVRLGDALAELGFL